jgi:hypothetical protein
MSRKGTAAGLLREIARRRSTAEGQAAVVARGEAEREELAAQHRLRSRLAGRTPCPVQFCAADELGTLEGGQPMLCRGYGHHTDGRCMADWASGDPEDWGDYTDWIAKHTKEGETPE